MLHCGQCRSQVLKNKRTRGIMRAILLVLVLVYLFRKGPYQVKQFSRRAKREQWTTFQILVPSLPTMQHDCQELSQKSGCVLILAANTDSSRDGEAGYLKPGKLISFRLHTNRFYFHFLTSATTDTDPGGSLSDFTSSSDTTNGFRL